MVRYNMTTQHHTSKTLPPAVINLFFILGLISALLFRSLFLFNYYYSSLSHVVWYCAVTGYLFFFGFRYYISRKRRRTIIMKNLLDKVTASDIAPADRDEINYILQSIIKSKEMFNYVFIFVVSIVAISVDIVLMVMRSAKID